MLHRVYDKVKETGLEVLLIDIREKPSTVRKVVKERNYRFPVLLDRDGAVTQSYAVWGTPTVYLIEPDGNLAGRAVGPRNWDSPEGARLLRSLAP